MVFDNGSTLIMISHLVQEALRYHLKEWTEEKRDQRRMFKHSTKV